MHTPSSKLELNCELLFDQDKVITNIYPMHTENNEHCTHNSLLLFDDNAMKNSPYDTTSTLSSDDRITKIIK